MAIRAAGLAARVGAVLLAGLLAALPALADGVDVEAVGVFKTGEDTYSFTVTLGHADEGWEHYADRIEVAGPGGEVLGMTILVQPHLEREQPLIRSVDNVRIPPGVTLVTVRAHDRMHGYAGRQAMVPVPR
ncbi:MAG: hypothetical protein HY521_14430 [Proteobacteria bacterium]|nr:hypothetical protein [Pseudomonadota bacterium]